MTIRARISLIALGVALSSAPAQAQQTAAAQTLFEEARQLVARGQYDAACPKLEESQRLDPGIGTQFHLADCWEKMGRTASAWARFIDVAAAAKTAGQRDREVLARKRAAALEPRLSRLVIEVKAPTAGLEVRQDGLVLGTASWGSAIALDPGKHVIDASAPSKASWTSTIVISENADRKTVAIPALESNGTASVTGVPDSAPQSSGDPNRTRHAMGFVVGGFGIAAAGVGAFFGARAFSKKGDRDDRCGAAGCDGQALSDAQALDASGRQAATISTIAFGVGLVGIGAGAWLLLGGQDKGGQAIWISPALAGRESKLLVGGAW